MLYPIHGLSWICALGNRTPWCIRLLEREKMKARAMAKKENGKRKWPHIASSPTKSFSTSLSRTVRGTWCLFRWQTAPVRRIGRSGTMKLRIWPWWHPWFATGTKLAWMMSRTCTPGWSRGRPHGHEACHQVSHTPRCHHGQCCRCHRFHTVTSSCVYGSPGGDVQTWQQITKEYTALWIEHTSCPTIVAWNTNTHVTYLVEHAVGCHCLLHCRQSKADKEIQRLLSKVGLEACNPFTSTHSSCAVIDLFLSYVSEPVEVQVLPDDIGLSDHCMVVARLRINLRLSSQHSLGRVVWAHGEFLNGNISLMLSPKQLLQPGSMFCTFRTCRSSGDVRY